jgi:hypothetical protein
MHVPPFDIPDEVFIDPQTGYAVNIPLGYQGYPGWQHDHPEVIQRIQLLRRELGIIIDDDHFIQPPTARPSDLLQDYIEQHGLNELAAELSARVHDAFVHMKATHGTIIKRRLPTSRRPRDADRDQGGPVIVEPIPVEESNRLFEEWFDEVVFVDGPDDELPELEPEDDDEPE